MKTGLVNRIAVVVLIGLPLAGGCGGGGYQPDPNPNPDPGSCPAPSVNAAGTWDVHEVATSATPDCNYWNDFTIEVTQDDANALVEVAAQDFNATICGNELRSNAPFTIPDGAGQSTITSLVLVLNGDTLAGTSEWNYTDGVNSCSGTSQWTATRR